VLGSKPHIQPALCCQAEHDQVCATIVSRSDEKFIPGPLQGASYCFVLDSSGGYSQLYAFLIGRHRQIFPQRESAPSPIEQKVIARLFPPPGKVCAITPTRVTPAVDEKILATKPPLALKPDIPPASRQDIRGLDWYDECDAGHFIGRDDDASRILSMLLSRPIIRLVGPSGVGKSSLIRAGLLPKIREFNWRGCVIRPFEDPAFRIPSPVKSGVDYGPGHVHHAAQSNEIPRHEAIQRVITAARTIGQEPAKKTVYVAYCNEEAEVATRIAHQLERDGISLLCSRGSRCYSGRRASC
jgi:hypothetical protein